MLWQRQASNGCGRPYCVADGFPTVDRWRPVRHLRLDMSHDDFGGTPRRLGALLATSEGYRGIGFLDADNWIADDHVERCVEAATEVGPDCDYVIARRFLTRPDGTTIDVKNPHLSEDVDTNCLFFLEGSYHSLHHWVTNFPATVCHQRPRGGVRAKELWPAAGTGKRTHRFLSRP